ncbi:hypothetical protein BT63DRAFT_429450 [Microthyrium microscopicum]|uniref:Integral membrane protein n=1 Tax=Microthyrium microscopicum TaxID=703497 RepID=A0A6A6TY03_9PEZI|nr:hypothetical protein BT63DRAFT_429450 [Microthyrium microscopicum]
MPQIRLVQRPITHQVWVLLSLITSFAILPSANAASNSSHAATNTSTSSRNSTYSIDDVQNGEVDKVKSQIKCYALPYGGIGAASHVLTYYCLLVNAIGRKPLMPWKLQQYAWLNIAIGTIQLIGSTITSVLAISRCSGHPDLQLLGVWMILTSLAASTASMLGHGRWIFSKRGKAAEEETVQQNENPPNLTYQQPYQSNQSMNYYAYELASPTDKLREPEQTIREPYTKICCFIPVYKPTFGGMADKRGQYISWGLITALWLAGCEMGAVGSVRIALKTFLVVTPVWKITAGFFGLPALFLIFWALSVITATTCKDVKESWNCLQMTWKVCLVFLVAMLFYMDFWLAAVIGNWGGLPQNMEKDGKILYWVYFGVKRLAFLSS